MGETEQKKSRRILERVWGNLSDFKEPTVVKKTVKGVLKGELLEKKVLTNNLGLITLIIVLAFIYVGTRYYVEDDMKEISRLQKELKDVRIEAITRSSELMEMSKQSAVIKSIQKKGLGLREATTPPMLIK